jgi:Flp pilus assembly protein TadG
MLALFRRLIRDRSGNVALMFAAALFPLVFLTGMAIDYTMASDRQAQLNGFADAAALSAVTPTMMTQSDSSAATTASNTFNTQATALAGSAGFTYQSSNLTVNVKTNSGGTRTATISYTAGSPTFFASLLGVDHLNLGGSATATAGLPPNINFYLLLDTSPSMAIVATSAGMQTLVNKTQSQSDGSSAKGCAFACHESKPSADNLGNPGGVDNYTYAKNTLGLTLRIDLVQQAASNLMSTANSTEVNSTAKTKPSYQMAIYTFDVAVKTIQTMTQNLIGTNSAQSATSNIKLLEVCNNNYLVCGTNNNDMDTDYDDAMNFMNNTMPDPGSGTNSAGDAPQEVLFLVTDGVQDYCVTPTLNSYSGGGCREQWYMNAHTDWCSMIKSRGIRIAVLYTTYVPMISPPMTNYTSSWYKNFGGAGQGINSFITATTDGAATSLATCASPGLFYEVQNDGDISAALSSLFQAAVQSAYLSK